MSILSGAVDNGKMLYAADIPWLSVSVSVW